MRWETICCDVLYSLAMRSYANDIRQLLLHKFQEESIFQAHQVDMIDLGDGDSWKVHRRTEVKSRHMLKRYSQGLALSTQLEFK